MTTLNIGASLANPGSRRFRLPHGGGSIRRALAGRLMAVVSVFALVALACSSGGGDSAGPEPTLAPTETATGASSEPSDQAAPAPDAPLAPAPPDTLTAGPGGVAPIELPVQGRIAFAALDGAIWIVDSEDGSLLQLSPPDEITGLTGHYVWPGWSPDGSQVTFTSLLPDGPDSIEITLMRAEAHGDEIPIKVHLDDPGSAGIAPGVPHYAGWSPNTSSIVLVTASSEGPEVVLRESGTGGFSQLLARGGPSYVSWAPDSRHLLVHRAEDLFLVTIDEAGEGTSVDVIGTAGSLVYRAPAWSPSGEEYIFVGGDPAVPELLLGRVGSTLTRSLGAAANNMAFTWSPDGASLGIFAGSTPDFESLTIIDTEMFAEIVRIDRPVVSAWWSPDSSQLAVASPSAITGQIMEWSVLDPVTGGEQAIGLLVATSEFAYTQTLFDQFSQTHDLWSPDSKALVFSGAFLDLNDLPEEIDDVEPGIWVVDAQGVEAPQRIAPGVVAFWSPP